jgi:hypothetical protein
MVHDHDISEPVAAEVSDLERAYRCGAYLGVASARPESQRPGATDDGDGILGAVAVEVADAYLPEGAPKLAVETRVEREPARARLAGPPQPPAMCGQQVIAAVAVHVKNAHLVEVDATTAVNDPVTPRDARIPAGGVEGPQCGSAPVDESWCVEQF